MPRAIKKDAATGKRWIEETPLAQTGEVISEYFKETKEIIDNLFKETGEGLEKSFQIVQNQKGKSSSR